MPPSPVNLSTKPAKPSKRSMLSQKMRKKRCMISDHASGSSCSASFIEPFTSTKSTVTSRRSPSTVAFAWRIFSARSGAAHGLAIALSSARRSSAPRRSCRRISRRPRSGRRRTDSALGQPDRLTPASSIPSSLGGYEHRGAFLLDQNHHEFRRLGLAGVPADDMDIVGAFLEGLSRFQCYLFSTLHLHLDGALQYVNHRMGVVSVDRVRRAG